MTPQQIDAMKLALEALIWEWGDEPPELIGHAITAIKQALAEHAMRETQRIGQEIEQEPVAWWNDTGTHIDLNVSGRGAPLYTAPPQRKPWVGLTDEEFHDLQIENIDDPWANFKAIEAKLKEKNCG